MRELLRQTAKYRLRPMRWKGSSYCQREMLSLHQPYGSPENGPLTNARVRTAALQHCRAYLGNCCAAMTHEHSLLLAV